MRVGIVLVGANAQALAFLQDYLERWHEAHVIAATTLEEAHAIARRHHWLALVLALFGSESAADLLDFQDIAHPLAWESVFLDPKDLAQAALILGVKAAKFARAGIIHKAREDATAPLRSSRRSFLSLGQQRKGSPSTRPVLLDERCRAPQGCRKCWDACSFKAITFPNRLPDVADACQRCGTCTAVCPTGALQSPVFSDDEWAGILEGMAASDLSPRTLILTCPQAAFEKLPRGVVAERLPCVGVLGVTHLAEAAAFTPASVAVYCPNPETCEKAISAHRLKADMEMVSACLAREQERLSLLEGIGLTPGEIASLVSRSAPRSLDEEAWGMPTKPSDPGAGRHRGSLSGQRRADFVAAVRQTYRQQVPVAPQGQLFAVTVDAHCTLCGACATVCADAALGVKESNDTLTLFFAGDRCIGCGFCAARCPEGALHLGQAEDIGDLMGGHATPLFTSTMARCRRCRAVLGSAPSVERVAALLADDPTVSEALWYCPTCKMARLAT